MKIRLRDLGGSFVSMSVSMHLSCNLFSFFVGFSRKVGD